MNFENVHGQIKVTPFSNYGWDNSITFAAATTCYQSESTTKKTPEDFVQMFKTGKHRTPLEFSWYVLSITTDKDPSFIWEYIYTLTKYIHVEIDYADRRIVLSGNGRAFFEFIEKAEVSKIRSYNPARISFINSLKNVLHNANPVLFDDEGSTSDHWDMVCLPSIIVNDNYAEEHRWCAVRIENVSIGMTRELNRHRTLSVNERSTRYTGAGRNDTIRYSHNFGSEYVSDICLYDTFLDLKLTSKKTNDISRQALPLMTCSEEIVAGRFPDWRHFVDLRQDTAAHYEIRDVADKMKSIIER